MWRCERQTRPATGRVSGVLAADPRAWLDQHTAELLARPGARLWGYAGPADAVRRTMDSLERMAVRDGRSVQRVIRIDDETITLTAEPV